MTSRPPSWNANGLTPRADNEVTKALSDRDTMITAFFPDLLRIGAAREQRPSQTLCRLLQLGLSKPDGTSSVGA